MDGGQGRGHRDDAQRRPGADGRGGQPGSAGQRSARPGECGPDARACSIAGWLRCFPIRPLRPKPPGARPTSSGRSRRPTLSTRSSRERSDAYMREQMDEDEMKKVIKFYPGTRQADLAAYDTDRQQALRRLAGPDQVPGEGVGVSTRSTRPSIPTARAPRRRFIRPSIGRRCSWTCTPPTGTTRRARAPSTAHAHELARQVKGQFPQSDYTVAGRWPRVQIGSRAFRSTASTATTELAQTGTQDFRSLIARPNECHSAFRRLFERHTFSLSFWALWRA